MVFRIHVDFNTMSTDRERRVSLPTHIESQLLAFLRPGLEIVVYEPFDFEVDATVEYDAEQGDWYGRPDWSTKRILESEEMHRFREVAYKCAELRNQLGDDSRGGMELRSEAEQLWEQLSKGEQDFLLGMPQYFQYDRSC